MDGTMLVFVLVVIVVVALGAFVLGTRARVSTGGGCSVDVHWWFGWWVRCVDGEDCPPEHVCVLLSRMTGRDEQWADAGVVPGGSVKWNEQMDYRCECRVPRR